MTRDAKETGMPHVDEGTLHAYLDGELPSAERTALETHLIECASCRATLAEERALLERASALLGMTRPAEQAAPPFEQLSRPRARRWWQVRTPVAWAASIVLALGLGYYLHQSPEQVAERQDVALHQEQDRPADAQAPKTPASTRRRTAAPVRRPPPPDTATRVGDELVMGETRVDTGVASATQTASGMAANRPSAAAAAPGSLARTRTAITASKAEESLITTTSWPIISRGAARSLLGTDPVGLPGLALQIRRSPANDGTVVVEQRIDSATTIQIFQQQNATAAFSYRKDPSARVDTARRAQERDMV